MPDAQHVILVRQYRYAVDKWLWELAAGSLEPGEDAEAGARRECEEETGLIAGQRGVPRRRTTRRPATATSR